MNHSTTSNLLDDLLKETDMLAFKEQLTALVDNKEAALKDLLSIFSSDIPLLSEESSYENPMILFFALKLAALFESTEAFPWIRTFYHLHPSILETHFDFDLILDQLPYLLAQTSPFHFQELKDDIENQTLDIRIREACLKALAFLVAKGHTQKDEVILYFKTLFQKILLGKIDDIEFATHLTSTCLDLGLDECLEDIRNLCGLMLINNEKITIADALKELTEKEDDCIELLKKELTEQCIFSKLQNFSLSLEEDEEDAQDVNFLFNQELELASLEAELAMQEPGRNDDCNCGSNKKYKKCCMSKNSDLASIAKAKAEECVISNEPLTGSDAVDVLTEEEEEVISHLYDLYFKDSKKLLEVMPSYLAKYAHVPSLYIFICHAYQDLGKTREAFEVLKDTLKQFPDYLLGKTEYALYLLRRGEADEAFAILNNANTLIQLYPNRKVFYFVEAIAFYHVLGLYWAQKEDIEQAKIYAQILSKIDPNCPELKDIQSKIKTSLFLQSINKNLVS